MAYLPSLKDGIIGFENSFFKVSGYSNFHLKILYFRQVKQFRELLFYSNRKTIFCCIRCDEFLERARYLC